MKNEHANYTKPDCGQTGDPSCKWVWDRKAGALLCTPGKGSCIEAELLTAEESDFHTAEVVDATRQINEILTSINDDGGDRKLSFIDTGQGMMLALVKHGGTSSEDQISSESDPEVVAEYLKLS